MDASKRISDLIVISQRLVDLLRRENAALRDHRTDDIQAQVNEKEEASRAYESRIAGLAEHVGGEEMDATDPTLKDRLRSLGQEIQDLSAENAMRLEIAMEVNRRVLHEVAEATKSAQPGAGTYSDKGAVTNGSRGPAQGSVPISLNKTL